MKETYEKLELDVIEFEMEDTILMMSTGDGGEVEVPGGDEDLG